MACPTKRQRQAKQQHTSGARFFTNGLSEDILEVTIDPNYHPDNLSDLDSGESNSEIHLTDGMSFSLMDGSDAGEESEGDGNSDSSGDESDGDIVCTGKKRKSNEDPSDTKAARIVNYVEQQAHQAAMSAHMFWADIMSSNNMKITSFFMPKTPAPTKDHRMPHMQLPDQGSPQLFLHNTNTPISSTNTILPPIPNSQSPMVPTEEDEDLVSFLDMMADDEDGSASMSVLETIKKLTAQAKQFKSSTSLFYLTLLKQFVQLWEKYQQNPCIKSPKCKASHTVAMSIGKGPYMA
ncbi:hypothetical protein EDC04DRAFT_2614578 [Pisolithus marmoratus]|nr:hypothetical protein EDC04DRAFT_2614578 [Pisolithus marmoratus]